MATPSTTARSMATEFIDVQLWWRCAQGRLVGMNRMPSSANIFDRQRFRSRIHSCTAKTSTAGTFPGSQQQYSAKTQDHRYFQPARTPSPSPCMLWLAFLPAPSHSTVPSTASSSLPPLRDRAFVSLYWPACWPCSASRCRPWSWPGRSMTSRVIRCRWPMWVWPSSCP